MHAQDDFYQILQVHPSAIPEVVDAAYRRLALKYHPDRNGTPEATSAMRQLNLAYEVLRDPGKRAAYDGQRAQRRPSRPTSPTSESAGPSSEHAQRPHGPPPVSSDPRDVRASYKTPISILLFVVVAVVGVLYSILSGGEAADRPTQLSAGQPRSSSLPILPSTTRRPPPIETPLGIAASAFGSPPLTAAAAHSPTLSDTPTSSPVSTLADAAVAAIVSPRTNVQPTAIPVPTPTGVPTTTETSSVLMTAAWPMDGNDPQHTGRTAAVGTQDPREDWSFDGAGSFDSSVAIGADGTLYAFANPDFSDPEFRGTLYAIDQFGAVRWEFPAPRLISGTPALGSDGIVYLGSEDGSLHALDADGSLRWSFFAGDNSSVSSPIIDRADTIYFGASQSGTERRATVYALDADATGKWAFTADGVISAGPALGHDGTLYASVWDPIEASRNKIFALDAQGKPKWEIATSEPVVSSPVVASDGSIYVSPVGTNLLAIDALGHQKWIFQLGGRNGASPAIGPDGTIYVGSEDHYLYAISSTGSLLWTFAVADKIGSSPIVGGDGTVYVGSWDGSLYAVNSDGTSRWSFGTGGIIGGSASISAEGTIYVGSKDGKLYAIGGAANNGREEAPLKLDITEAPTTTPSVAPTPAPINRPRRGSTTSVFSGAGQQATLPFYVDSTPWKLRWTADSAISIFLSDPLSGGNVIRIVDDQPSGSELVYARLGNFYFTVYADTDSEWELSVETLASVDPSIVGPGEPSVFSGAGQQATLPFYVDSTPWKLRWTADSAISIFLSDPLSGGNVIRIVDDQPSGSELVYARLGNFYFTVYADTDSEWELSVETLPS